MQNKPYIEQQKKVKCNKCGFIGAESEFPHGRDFLQKRFVSACPKCDNVQSPGDSSLRMFGGKRPFEFVRDPRTSDEPVDTIRHNQSEAS